MTWTIIGLLLLFFSAKRSYNVFFDTSSKDYWETSWGGGGGKFRQGCMWPVVFSVIAIILLGAGVEIENKKMIEEAKKENQKKIEDQRIKDLQLQKEKEKQVEEEKEKAKAELKVKYDHATIMSYQEFERFVGNNYKGLMVKEELNYLEDLLKKAYTEQRSFYNEAKKEHAIVKKLNLPTNDKKKKLNEVARKGNAAKKQLGKLSKMIKYLQSVYSKK